MSELAASPITQILGEARAGSPDAVAALLALVYDDLRALAAHRLAALPPGQTLMPTELVHEAFVRMVKLEDRTWENRRHFIDAAGVAMRCILVDRARARNRLKRGGGARRHTLDEAAVAAPEHHDDERIELVDGALRRLEAVDPRAARVVTLKFFLGLNEAEIAYIVGVTERTVRRDWAYAKTWLQAAIDDQGRPGELE